MLKVEARADFENRRVILFSEDEKELYTPGAILQDVEVIEDSEGAILVGTLVETIGRNYVPSRRAVWRLATFTRSGQLVDRRNQRRIKSCTAAIVKAGTVYYLGD